jgi:hypothetical protein
LIKFEKFFENDLLCKKKKFFEFYLLFENYLKKNPPLSEDSEGKSLY